MERKKSVFVTTIFLILFALLMMPPVSAGIVDWINQVKAGITGRATSQTVTFNLTIANTAPNITYITMNATVSPTENTNTLIIVNFTAWDPDGISNLDTKGGKVNFTKTGEALRQNSSSCLQTATWGTYYANYTCTMYMWYFDTSGTWNVTALVNDSSNGVAQNQTVTFTYNQLSAFVTHPAALTWASLSPGTTNQTSNNDPLVLNNTGNKNITSGNVQINATNLKGETDNTKAIWAGNMSVAILTGSSAECNENTNQSAAFSPGVFTNATNGTLMVGNHSVANVGNRNLYLCIRTIGSELTSQSYSTTSEGAWTIKIL